MNNTDKEAPARNKGKAPQTDEAAKTKVEKKPQTKAKDAVAQDASTKMKAVVPAAPLPKPAPAARTKARPERVVEAGNAPETETTSAEATEGVAQAAPVEPAQPALVEAMEADVVELEPMYAPASKQQAPIEAEEESLTEAKASPAQSEWKPSEVAPVEEESASSAEIESADIQKIGEKLSEREKIEPEKSVTIFMADFNAIAAEIDQLLKKVFGKRRRSRRTTACRQIFRERHSDRFGLCPKILHRLRRLSDHDRRDVRQACRRGFEAAPVPSCGK